MKFWKKPVVIEAIDFDEFVEYGRQVCGMKDFHNNMPWSFKYKGHQIHTKTINVT